MKAEIILKGTEEGLIEYSINGDSIIVFSLIHFLLDDILTDSDECDKKCLKYMCNDILNKIDE